MTSFLCVALQDVSKTFTNDQRNQELALATAATTKLSEWLLAIERCPRYMSVEQSENLHQLAWEFLVVLWQLFFVCLNTEKFFPKLLPKHVFFYGIRFLDIYQCLAHYALANEIFRWPIKPKFHATLIVFSTCFRGAFFLLIFWCIWCVLWYWPYLPKFG